MGIGENIRNALLVLYGTYENVHKLIDYCTVVARESGYLPVGPRFLRWKSDNDTRGWLINSFVLLYQGDQEEDIEGSDWRNGPVYALDICLGKKHDKDYIPMIHMSKFEFENMAQLGGRCSAASHWVFHNPVHGDLNCTVSEKEGFRIAEPNERMRQQYWGLRRVVSTTTPLADITAENLRERAFDTLELLKCR